MQALITLLHAEGCSCVIRRNNGEVRLCHERGVQDLYRLLRHEPEWLRHTQLADKVIGKAAAALMVLGEVREVYADVVSQPALDLLGAAGITVSYDTAVPYIINRTRTGWCPLETRCRDCASAEECLLQIEEFVASQREGRKE